MKAGNLDLKAQLSALCQSPHHHTNRFVTGKKMPTSEENGALSPRGA
jgi:hypothetical protein